MNSDNLINIDKSILPAYLRVAIVDGKAFPVGVNKTGNEGVVEYYKCATVDHPREAATLSIYNCPNPDANGEYIQTGTMDNGYPVYSKTPWQYYFSTSGDNRILTNWSNGENTKYSSATGSDIWYDDYTGEQVIGNMYSVEGPTINVGSKTWTGYKAILTDGAYSFKNTVTEGLTYTTMMPEVGKIYSGDGALRVGYMYLGTAELPEDEGVVTVFRLDDYKYTDSSESHSASGYLEPQQDNTFITGDDLPQFASDEVSAFRITSTNEQPPNGLSTNHLDDKLPGYGQSFMMTASVYIDSTNINNYGWRHVLGYGGFGPDPGVHLLICISSTGSISVAAHYGVSKLTYDFPEYTKRDGVWITFAVSYDGERLTLYATDGALTENAEDSEVASAEVSLGAASGGISVSKYASFEDLGSVSGYAGSGTGYAIVTSTRPTEAARVDDYWLWWQRIYRLTLICGLEHCDSPLCDNWLLVSDECAEQFSHYKVADKCDGCGKLYCPEHVGYTQTCRQCGDSYCMDCFTFSKCPAGPSVSHES